VDACLRTKYPNIFACGDVAGPFQFTHAASHQAWFAAVNALARPFKSFAVDYTFLPWVTFTSPEIARVGLNETDARAKGIAFEVTRYGLDDLDRAIADGTDEGFVKVLTPPGSDKILGVTIVGEHAGELLPEFVTCMKHGLGLNKILGTIHSYPTMSEANKYAAGIWRRAHAPQGALKFLEKFHAWRRG
jgi:pyruvate/2-oxoglutarate dehydrogenase complex dihydrolipoamide dehydrogenase (E3) component